MNTSARSPMLRLARVLRTPLIVLAALVAAALFAAALATAG
jgi:hypothetical protein